MENLHPYLIPVATRFSEQADAINARAASAYLLNQFAFFGLKTPLRRLLSREHYRRYPLQTREEMEAIVRSCFSLPQREFQYFGIELLGWNKHLWKPDTHTLFEYCIVTKSWWDSVDAICSECTGPFFKKFPKSIPPVTRRWNRSGNTWLQRSSIMFQKSYRSETDTALLTAYILHCSRSKEFFIQKAIGWALREYGKTNPGWVTQFVDEHPLPALSKREALKRIG